jgi:nitrous oxide reductase accessory protein NosL
MRKVILFLLGLVLSVSFLNAGDLKVPKDARDPLFHWNVNKYGNLVCMIELKNGKKAYFSSVKSMMDFYYRPWFYVEYGAKTAKDIKKMVVQDYLTGKTVDAKKALYVFGSRLIGPKGDDLIPFADEASLKMFEAKYGGTKVLPFSRISKGLIKYLDMQ